MEAVGGALGGVGFPIMPGYHWNQGTVISAIMVDAFQPLAEFERQVAELGQRIRGDGQIASGEDVVVPDDPQLVVHRDATAPTLRQPPPGD